MSYSHSYKSFLILPMLGLLCVSPSELKHRETQRSIATESSSFDSSIFPKFDAKADPLKGKVKNLLEVTLDQSNKQIAEVQKSIDEKKVSDETILLVLQSQADVNKLLDQQKITPEQGIESLDKIADLKKKIELELAAGNAKVSVVKKDLPKKEETKKEEKKEEEKKSEDAPCEQEEHKIASVDLNKFIKDQSEIMNKMVQMMQTMMYMNMVSMRMNDSLSLSNLQYPTASMYGMPSSFGQWNYYPQYSLVSQLPAIAANSYSGYGQASEQPQPQPPQHPTGLVFDQGPGWQLAPSSQFNLGQPQQGYQQSFQPQQGYLQSQVAPLMPQINTGNFGMSGGPVMAQQFQNPMSFNFGS